ncbi:hypothetical protein M885DRAFT_509291, partial [Pelagophyceae sp. CCMP2097]
MLKKLYGGAAGHPNIAYPQLRTKPSTQPPAFIPGGAKIGSADPRAKTRIVKEVAVPRRVAPPREYSAIDLVPHLKPKRDIDAFVAETKLQTEGFRPAVCKPVSTDEEKARLQERCEWGGGKALPAEMTQAGGALPSKAAAQAKERARVNAVWRRRRGEPEPSAPSSGPADLATQRVEMLTREIEDRQKYLVNMTKLGVHNDATRRVDTEITIRKHELRKAVRAVEEDM